MTNQHRLPFQDSESVTRRPVLNVVHAHVESVADFNESYFAGYNVFRALTYTSSIPMVANLLRQHDFDDFECIFGHNGILSREAEEILAFQAVVREKLETGLLGLKRVSAERRELIYNRIAEGKVRFFVVKDAIAHAKIYLLEKHDAQRVITGSANLSERAFSGRQAETLIVFDNDQSAWDHYAAQYDAVRDTSTSDLPVDREPLPVNQVRIERTPALIEADMTADGTTLYVPGPTGDELDYSFPEIVSRMATIKPILRRGLAGAARPDRQGGVRLTPRTVKEIVRVVRSRAATAGPPTYLSRHGDRFILSDQALDLSTNPDEVRADVTAWLAFFNNYEEGFVGDVPRLQRDYFTFMSWFYFAPLMCDMRNAALRKNVFSFDQPLFAVLYGSSNCGKTSLVETVMASMFVHPRIVNSADFTPAKLRGLQHAYKRFPVVFDDVKRDRFNRHADEIIKDESIPYAEYPCFALSMNADARSFKAEIVKRCLMIYTRTALPGDNTSARQNLQRSVAAIRERMTTSLYREYLKRILQRLENNESDDPGTDETDTADALHLSSTTLCALFDENLPPGTALPHWCAPMRLSEYQKRAFERPRLILDGMLSTDRYSPERRPPERSWTIVGDRLIVPVASMEFSRIKADIPDWLLDDTGTSASQISLDRKLTEDFLGRPIRSPSRWAWWKR